MTPGKMLGWSIVSAVLLVMVALTVEDTVQRAFLSLFAAAPLFYVVYDSGMRSKRIAERRSYLGLRKVTDDFLDQVRNLNRLKVIAQSDRELGEAEEMIEQVVQQMHALVDEIREMAGKTGPVEDVTQPPKRREAAAAGKTGKAEASGGSGR